MTIYKQDIDEAKRRVDAWWNHEIIDRAVLQPGHGDRDQNNVS